MDVYPIWGGVRAHVEDWDVDYALQHGCLSNGQHLTCRLEAWAWLRLRQVWEQDEGDEIFEDHLWGLMYIVELSIKACFRSGEKTKIRLRHTILALKAVSRLSRKKDIMMVSAMSWLGGEEREVNFC